jgi:hypothetical protein
MSEQQVGSEPSFGPFDAGLQMTASFYDGAFAYIRSVNPAGAGVIDNASSIFGYSFLGGSAAMIKRMRLPVRPADSACSAYALSTNLCSSPGGSEP